MMLGGPVWRGRELSRPLCNRRSALTNRFGQSGGPRNPTLVFAAGQGDGGSRGLNRLAREGLIR